MDMEYYFRLVLSCNNSISQYYFSTMKASTNNEKTIQDIDNELEYELYK